MGLRVPDWQIKKEQICPPSALLVSHCARFVCVTMYVVWVGLLIGERAKRVRHPLLLPIKKMFGCKYVKTTMTHAYNFT